MKSLIVQKYGGTSVGNLACMENVAANIKQTLNKYENLVVVVSAMGKYTDDLLKKAYKLNSKPPRRELDMLITTGERVSMSLLCIALSKLGVNAISLTGSQSGIVTDDVHGNARIHKILGDRIKCSLNEKKVVIVAGFQGISTSKEITSLGRGGSDLTAIALAISLKAEACDIYTDVQGVYRCDPQVYPKAKVIKQIPWSVMTELAWAGSGILHHRGAFLAAKYSLPLLIRSSHNLDNKGTLIKGKPSMEQPLVTAISSKRKQVFVQFKFEISEQDPICLHQILKALWNHEESPYIFQFHEINSNTCILSVLIGEEFEDLLNKEVQNSIENKNIKIIESTKKENMACLSVIGHGFRQSPEIVCSIFKLLGNEKCFAETKDMSISFVVKNKDIKDLTEKLHKELFEKEEQSKA